MSPAVALHLACTTAALGLGGAILLRMKGTASHRWLGRLWVCLMAGTAISSLWIPAFLQFSWIHLFILVVSITIPKAVIEIRRGNWRSHRGWMIGTFIGLIGAGIGAVTPGRLIGDSLQSALGWR